MGGSGGGGSFSYSQAMSILEDAKNAISESSAKAEFCLIVAEEADVQEAHELAKNLQNNSGTTFIVTHEYDHAASQAPDLVAFYNHQATDFTLSQQILSLFMTKKVTNISVRKDKTTNIPVHIRINRVHTLTEKEFSDLFY